MISLIIYSVIYSQAAENLLKRIGDEIMHKMGHKRYLTNFSRNAAFLKALYQVTRGFWATTTEKPDEDIGLAFASHKSYEIGLFFFISLIEEKELVQGTIPTLVEANLLPSYIDLLANGLQNDICYHTQVITYIIYSYIYIIL